VAYCSQTVGLLVCLFVRLLPTLWIRCFENE